MSLRDVFASLVGSGRAVGRGAAAVLVGLLAAVVPAPAIGPQHLPPADSADNELILLLAAPAGPPAALRAALASHPPQAPPAAEAAVPRPIIPARGLADIG
jgi:hypothetical protein